jgi:peptidoglycan DL-endopeptidase LytE
VSQQKIVEEAKKLVGVALWKWGASLEDAPRFFDCSSLIQWLYRQSGIEIPRRVKDQMKMLNPCRALVEAQAGDLLFVTSPYVHGVFTNNQQGLHVSLVASGNTVISATNSELGKGVVEISIEQLLKTRNFICLGMLDPG